MSFNSNMATGSDLDGLLSIGISLFTDGRYSEAIAIFRQAYEENPKNSHIKNYLFTCYAQYGYQLFSANDMQGAIRNFEHALLLNEAHDGVRKNLAILYNESGVNLFTSGRVDESIPILHKAIELCPNSLAAKRILLNYYRDQAVSSAHDGNPSVRIDLLERAREMDGSDKNIGKMLGLQYYMRGAALYENGNIRDALNDISRAIKLLPGNQEIISNFVAGHIHLATELLATQDLGASIRHFSEAFSVCPVHEVDKQRLSFFTYQIGSHKFSQRNYRDAALAFKRAASIEIPNGRVSAPILRNIYIYWWICAKNEGICSDFIEFCSSMLVYTNDTIGFQEWIAASCKIVSEIIHNDSSYSEAIPFLSRIISLDPSDIWAHNLLGACFRATNDYVRAIRHYSISMKYDRDQTEAPYRLSQIIMLLKGRRQALLFCSRMLNNRPSVLIAKQYAGIFQYYGVRDDFKYYPYPKYNADNTAWSAPNSLASLYYNRQRRIRVLSFGPCQGFGISRTLEPLLKMVADADILYINSGQTHVADITLRKYAKLADVVILRKISSSQSSPEENQSHLVLMSEISKTCEVITYPAMENWSFWPINFFHGRIDTSRSFLKILKSGCDAESIIRKYNAGDIDFEFSKRFHDSMSITKFTERYTDIKVSEYIQRNHMDRIMFTYGSHPAISLYIECVRQIYQEMFERGVIASRLPCGWKNIYNSWPDDSIHPAEFFPIDKYSYNHFKFKWCSAEDVKHSLKYYHSLVLMARNLVLKTTLQSVTLNQLFAKGHFNRFYSQFHWETPLVLPLL